MFENKILNEDGVWEITPRDVAEALKQGAAAPKIVDVRRPEEFNGELGHIEGAELVTLETDFANEFVNWDRAATYVFVCRSGGRSNKVAAFAQAMGFLSVFNMSGGMIEWNAIDLPVVDSSGTTSGPGE